ncbi:MAG: aminotransferase class I/II-fold pyridoxal phosphate-dependent enzyme [Myxococcales bacterium]|nr:aminotransferase class I/II-fold pyridoxal phosphate-dependent enzyme [Myxococcota bacterium]MDW8283371.1 aminotransferase class I/II-fold pyridoxal phosphate-dependent enzyme [Myxococcales bacterium]
MRIGSRLASLAISDIRAMTRACEEAGGINLGQGLCDLPTPPLVAQGAHAAIDQCLATYAPPAGLSPLRLAVANKIAHDYGLHLDPEHEVVITAGATGAFAAAVLALFEPGDEMILLEPFYGYHYNTLVALGLRPVLVPLRPPDWELSRAALEAAVTPQTRGIVLCTPCNPSGKVFSEAELDVVAAFCEQHDLIALTDEIYEHIVFDGGRHVPLATRGAMRQRTVTISGFSKTFAVTGWRVGYLSAPAGAVPSITVAHDLLYVCAPTPLQHGALRGLAMDKEYFTALSRGYQRKRDILCAALEAARLFPSWPQGAYYVLADVSRLGLATSREAAMHILARVGVATVAGSSFYRDPVGERLVRLCFAKEDDVLEEAARRLRAL